MTTAAMHGRTATFQRVTEKLEWPMAVLALAVIPALLLDDSSIPRVHLIANTINWIVWLAFCGEFGLRLGAAPDRPRFLRHAWLDLAIIVVSPPFGVPEALQGLRAVRAFRLLRLVRALAFLSIGLKRSRRALHHRKFHYVLVVTVGVILLGASGLYVIERGQNESLTSFGDALWWAISTVATVGYGEIYPHTVEGRLIAVLLMLTGIGVISVFTATIASLFMIEEDEDEFNGLHKRFDEMQAKLDRLLHERNERAEAESRHGARTVGVS